MSIGNFWSRKEYIWHETGSRDPRIIPFATICNQFWLIWHSSAASLFWLSATGPTCGKNFISFHFYRVTYL